MPMGSFPTTAAVSRGLHHVVAEGTPDLHTVVGVEGVYRFVSAAGAAAFGWTPDDLLGERQALFTHPDDEALVDGTHWALLADGTAVVTTVRRFRCRDGTYRWTESRSRVDDSHGEHLVVSAVRDIADRRQSELNLQRQADSDPLTGI